MPRASNTTVRRAQIVDGLLAVMAREGYERASVARIAGASRLTPGLVHYHFESKGEILVALVGELERRVSQRVEARLARVSAGAARVRLAAYVDAHLATGAGADAAAVACWVAIGAEAIRQPEVARAYRAVLERAVDRLAALVRAVLVEDGRATRGARAMAAAIAATIEGAYRLAAAAPGVVPAGSAAPSLVAMVDGLLASAPPAVGPKRRAKERTR